MKTKIYYFSGTGNSLFVAKELCKLFGECEIIPIVNLIGEKNIIIESERVGFVFPVHAITIPIIFKEFFKKIRGRWDYSFAVATRGGTVFRGFESIERILGKKDLKLNSQFIINMPMNDPREKDYTCPSLEEMASINNRVVLEIMNIYNIISSGNDYKKKDTTVLFDFNCSPWKKFILEQSILLGMNLSKYIGGVNYFYCNDKCIKCGICEKICLSKKIKLKDNQPVWNRKVLCYMCFACINYCPAKSIQISSIPYVKSHTIENPRYHHPDFSAKDISMQK